MPRDANYLWNYQEDLAQYSSWQRWLKLQQPLMQAVRGENDPFFKLAGVDTLKIPKARGTTPAAARSKHLRRRSPPRGAPV